MKREAVEYVVDSQAFTRALRFLKHARASKARSVARELTWREAEAALHARVGALTSQYERAQRRVAAVA